MIKVKKKKKETRKGSIERGAKAPRTRALLARGCDAALPIAPPSPTKRNEKRTRRAAAALKWTRGKGLRTWARGQTEDTTKDPRLEEAQRIKGDGAILPKVKRESIHK